MYIVVNVGCIECGVSSNIVGVFESEEKAYKIADTCQEKYACREDGHNSFEVFEVTETEKIHEDYEIDIEAYK